MISRANYSMQYVASMKKMLSLSNSGRRSATVKCRPATSISLSQQPKEGVYHHDALLPPGISNIANNCYASSVYRCLLNHPVFLSRVPKVIQEHDILKCNQCKSKGT